MHRKTEQRSIRLILIGLAFVCLGCQPAPEKSEVDLASVRETLAREGSRFSQAYMDGDVETMVSIYTDDAVLFPGGSDVIRGEEAIRNYWNLPAGRTITLHKMTPVEVEISDSMASDYGYYEVSGINGENAWGPTRGKYLVVWRLGKDGNWRMKLDMWNSMPVENN